LCKDDLCEDDFFVVLCLRWRIRWYATAGIVKTVHALFAAKMCLRDVVVFAIPGWGDAHDGVHAHPSSSKKGHKLHLLKIMNKKW
jgi:hypothetical protein